ncbi:Low-affinity phosphate transporter PHO91 [Candida viswanathii]|uniref:Low-affinity phosphate transporter PHO91 n=1 Tax=Candida viswanathii TaxID=5486 RepID=A0A367XTM9_9ASCO|nr:Low-affinity phosphate transporter PHO91 [Candida viswanathii]
MKFSHSLQFNAVPEWSSKYIAYTTLKKLIYSLQRDTLRRSYQQDDEATLEGSHLISENNNYASTGQLTPGESPSTVFIAALDAELKKIDTFYQQQESYIFSSMDELMVDIDNFEREVDESLSLPGSNRNFKSTIKQNQRRDSNGSHDNYITNTTDPDTEFTQPEDEDEEDYDEESGLTRSYRGSEQSSRGERRVARRSGSVPDLHEHNHELGRTRSVDDFLNKSPKIWEDLTNATLSSNVPPQLLLLSESRIILRKRVIGLYTTLSELKSYIELNYTGFKKALKKFDKSLDTNIKDEYLNSLPERSYVFKKSTMQRVDERLESLVKLYALICNHGDDLETAKQELSIHLREHVVWERNTVWRDMIGLERKSYAANSKLINRGDGSKDEKEDGGGKGKVIDKFNISLKNPVLIKLVTIFIIAVILLNVSPFDDSAQRNCFALLICASLLWATEAIPLFVTSLLIPLLIVVLNVIKNDDGTIMDTVDTSKFILSTMWNSVILLLLGGFTLAAALSKYHIAKLISTWILSKAGTNPSVVLLTIMGVALFASMWISNVAAPVLCFSLIQPLLRTLPKGSQFINALIMGIALASNVGGMASPIASPQNMIAIGSMEPPPSWGEWFVVALPVCILSLLLIWVFLLVSFNCNSRNTHLVAIRTIDDKFTNIQWYIITVSFVTIFLWCIASRLSGVFGEMGIIALIPIILFFGSGLLTTEDFNNYPWNIVVLAMGGTALGKAVASSGLLTTIAVSIQHQVEDLSLLGVTLTLGIFILTIATFISHTVSALIVVPLVSEIGNNMPDPHPRMLILSTALLCSAAMGLPTSGFPNVTAICMTDEFGKPYLTVGTFIRIGVPSSIIAYAIIVTVGHATMKIINF